MEVDGMIEMAAKRIRNPSCQSVSQTPMLCFVMLCAKEFARSQMI